MRLPTSPVEITPGWLGRALGVDVEQATVEKVIPGAATKVRVRISDDETVIVKGPMSGGDLDEATLSFFALEVAFYRDVSHIADVGAPRCFYGVSRLDEGQAIVVLEDLRDVEFFTAGDTLSAIDVSRGLETLASLHAASWQHPVVVESDSVYPGPMRKVLTGMLNGRYWAGCLARPRSRSIPEHLRRPDALRLAVERLWERDASRADCVVHGDAHIGNVYRRADGRFGLIDWQMSLRGHWSHDVAYFVGSAVDPSERAAVERDLLGHYLTCLADLGGPALDSTSAWADYCAHMIEGLFWATNADGMYPEEINSEMVARFSRAVTELDDGGATDC